jgi:ankyrin repeat protein
VGFGGVFAITKKRKNPSKTRLRFIGNSSPQPRALQLQAVYGKCRIRGGRGQEVFVFFFFFFFFFLFFFSRLFTPFSLQEPSLRTSGTKSPLEEWTDALGLGDESSQNVAASDALFAACKSGNIDAVDELLEKGHDVNHKTPADGSTPLHAAVLSGSSTVVAKLVERGADPTIPNSNGTSPIVLAVQGGDVEVARTLVSRLTPAKLTAIRNAAGHTLLYMAAHKNDSQMARMLLEADVPPSVSAEDTGNTPLHVAAFRGNAEICKLLLLFDAPVNVESSNGFTPLHVAAAAGAAPVVRLLLQHGADASVRSRSGMLPADCTSDPALAAFMRDSVSNVVDVKGTVSAPVFGMADRLAAAGGAIHLPVPRAVGARKMRERIISHHAKPLSVAAKGTYALAERSPRQSPRLAKK